MYIKLEKNIKHSFFPKHTEYQSKKAEYITWKHSYTFTKLLFQHYTSIMIS